MILLITSLLSFLSLLFPRLIYALYIFSRSGRFSEYCRKGRRLALCRVNNHFPGCPAALASSAALWQNHSGRPARSSCLSTKSWKALFSFNTLLLKVIPSVESSLLISRRRACCFVSRLAPERTKLL